MGYKGFGLGCMHMRTADFAQSGAVIRAALEEGVTFLNTGDFGVQRGRYHPHHRGKQTEKFLRFGQGDGYLALPGGSRKNRSGCSTRRDRGGKHAEYAV